MNQLYLFFSLVLIFSVLMTISSYNPIHSVFWLVLVFINSSLFIISLGFEFLGFILIIIYVGAITILFLFVIMMLDIFQISKIYDYNNILPILFFCIFQFFINLDLIFFFSKNNFTYWNIESSSNLKVIANLLYCDLGIVFIIISILLLVAMVGAIVLTLDKHSASKKQLLSNQHQRNNSWT